MSTSPAPSSNPTASIPIAPTPPNPAQPELCVPTARLEPFLERLRSLAPRLAERAARHDAEGSFVAESYAELKAAGFFAAAVPSELGGGGLSHSEVAELLRVLAQTCPSSALALSMHQHLVAANVYRYLKGQPGEAVLRKVASGTVLVSTGGRDWLDSNGTLRPVEGGYRLSARKAFASGCEAGDVIVSSARLEDPERGPLVLHFSVPRASEGVRLEDDWDTLGMRGTGSKSVVLEDVFVPASAVSLERAAGAWHPVWGVVLMVAMPLIMAAYLGVAEAAAERATEKATEKTAEKPVREARSEAKGEPRTPLEPSLPYLLGELGNELTTARLAVKDMVALANNYDFEPTLSNADAILTRKTIASRAILASAEKALELAGGVGFYRSFGLERLLRDVHGAQFHPLPEKQQLLFSGRVALGLGPVAPA